MQTLSTNETTIRTRQEYETSGAFWWLTGATHGRCEFFLRFLVHGCGDERGPDGTGANGVDADPLADLLVGKSAGEGYDGTFGGGIAGGLLVVGLKK